MKKYSLTEKDKELLPSGIGRPPPSEFTPNTKRAKEAVAWTFNMTEEEYAPLVES